MSKREITNTLNLKFEPFDRYGSVIPGMSWHKISFDKKNGYGTYISKLEPGAKTISHTHLGFEEFFKPTSDNKLNKFSSEISQSLILTSFLNN